MQNLLLLVPYLRRNWRLFTVVLVLGLLGQVALLEVPRVVQKIIRLALERHGENIFGWALLVLALMVLRGGLSAAETILGARVGQQVLRDLRQDIYVQLLRLKLRFFDQTRSGELLSRMTADLEPIDGFFAWGSRLIIRNILLFIGVLILCLSMNVKLTIISLAFMPLITATALIIGTRLRPAWQLAREGVGDFSSALEETLSGIRVVKIYTQEERETRKLTRISEDVKEQTWRANRLDATYYPLTGLWSGAAGLVVLAYGGMQVINGQLKIDQYVSFEMYVMFLLVPMRMLGWMVSGVQRAGVAAGRIAGLLTEVTEQSGNPRWSVNSSESVTELESESETAGNPKLTALRGQVSFEDITFGYRENEAVLRDLNLVVQPGEIIGILGPTGGGKSALVSLIPRLYDPQAGRVVIDGYDVREYDLEWLRRQVGVVFQEPFLFSGTIRENISFGRPDASQEEIEAAARFAALEDFIRSLEKGYETRIGERGLNLSGGQQQRMTVARTLLMNPRILILDDCTSSVDADTEFHIQQSLSVLMKGRTSFVIAQRASSVATAHRIIVIDQGQIVEQGTPPELARIPDGHYRRLLDVQRALGISRKQS